MKKSVWVFVFHNLPGWIFNLVASWKFWVKFHISCSILKALWCSRVKCMTWFERMGSVVLNKTLGCKIRSILIYKTGDSYGVLLLQSNITEGFSSADIIREFIFSLLMALCVFIRTCQHVFCVVFVHSAVGADTEKVNLLLKQYMCPSVYNNWPTDL